MNKAVETARRAAAILGEPLKLALYPNKCICCGKILDEDKQICSLCRHWIERVDAKKRCLVCGYDKRHCRCKSNVYHFKGMVAPFYNAGLAQRAFYQYKFTPKKHYASYFSAKMADTVRKELANIKFDCICVVPTSGKTIRQKGFDHAGLLAKQLGELLGLPVCDVLVRLKGGKPQHTLSLKERFLNARGRYTFKKHINAGRVLLVDDILTSGATLDECSRQLLFAGADEVYCVTALITDPEFEPGSYAKQIDLMIVDC